MRSGPVRVLLVAPSLDILGGQAIQADRLCRLFQAEPRLAVEFLSVNPRLPGVLRHLQRIKYVRTLVTSLAYGWSLRRVRHCDVVHAFSASYWSFLLAPVPALLAARLAGKPSILNYRSGEAGDHLQNWRSALWGVRQASRVVVPSGYLVAEFGRFGIPAKAIPNTVDLDRFAYRQRDPLEPRFFSNRNFEALYNVACTLRCFARVQARYPDAALTLAGDGPLRGDLEQLAAQLGLRRTVFLGRVNPQEMAACYASHDIYLNSPDIDNMPTSILEASSAGLPVVSTDAGGIPYMIEHGKTGRLVARGDDEAMAREVFDLLENPIRARQQAEAARAACVRYAWPMVKEQWVALYENLTAQAVLTLRSV